jgi:hypothetical protein
LQAPLNGKSPLIVKQLVDQTHLFACTPFSDDTSDQFTDRYGDEKFQTDKAWDNDQRDNDIVQHQSTLKKHTAFIIQIIPILSITRRRSKRLFFRGGNHGNVPLFKSTTSVSLPTTDKNHKTYQRHEGKLFPLAKRDPKNHFRVFTKQEIKQAWQNHKEKK